MPRKTDGILFELQPRPTKGNDGKPLLYAEPVVERRYDLDDIESRNIEMGLRQLCEGWIDTNTIFGSTMAAVEEYGEVFRTKGEQKKAMREIAEVKADTDAQL